MPAHIRTYDGTEDPEDHLQIFTGAARIEKWTNAECCLMFMQTLVGSARIWFNDLPAQSIRSFDDLSRGFLANFSQQRRYVKDATVIFQIKQRDDESLRAFIERYKKEGLTYVGADEKMRVAGFMNAITSKYLTRDFNKSLPKTLEEALERAEAHIRGEEAVDIKEQRKRGSGWRSSSPARKRGNFNSYDRRSKGSDPRRVEGRNPPSRDKSMSFTPLTKTPQEILATEEVKQNFRPPRPLPKSRKNENSTQFCEFHEEKGHHTNDCFQLKKRIEEAVKSGELAHLVKGVRDKMAENKGKEVNMVCSDEKVPYKKRRLEDWELQCVCFPPTRKDPLPGPLVVEAIVGTLQTCKAYIDTGAATEIMFEKFFNQLSNEERSRLQPSETSIKGIADITLKPLGQITLDVCLKEGSKERTRSLTFVVINIPSNYDVIIGRPGQCAFYMAVSVGHGTVKFPTERGIATLQPSQEAYLIEGESSNDEKNKQGLVINPKYPEQRIRVNPNLSQDTLSYLEKLLKHHSDVFAWSPEDMTGIPRSIAEHELKIPPNVKPVVQKKRSLAPERSLAACQEVEKLVSAGILREVKYQSWIANPVMVRKPDNSWRMCIDFKDLNKACPKDCYPLPEIDLKVDSLTGYPFKCFLDAYKGYHQILMKEEDEEKTAFHTDKGIFCYQKMPFDLKNAGATYQRLVDKAFESQIGRNMEAYVDDLVIKSKTEYQMLDDIQETFKNLRKINMKLNPEKCSFGFDEGKFLGHIVGKQSIKANPNKVKAVLEAKPPRTKKEVESLNGKLAALKRFTSKLAERSLPFYKTLKNCSDKKDFRWTDEAEEAFNQMKQHLASLPDIAAPETGELISVYLSVADEAISAVLTIERDKAQVPVYFFSKTLKLAETKYPPLEKLALALVQTARRLRRYFQAHPIQVVTDQPVKNVLEKPENSGRLAKWAVELGEHNITYVPRKAIKAQVLADFLVEVPSQKTEEVNTTTTEPSNPEAWKLFTDGASSVEGSGAGVILINPEGLEFTYALRFNFQTTNNEAEYEALIAGLRLAKEMKVKKLEVFTDSLLVSSQVNDSYVAKEPNMRRYKEKSKELMNTFQACNIKQIPRSQNKKADALSKLASLTFAHLTKKVLVEVLKARSIDELEVQDVVTEEDPNWMTPIKKFLQNNELPSDQIEAERVKIKARQYVLQGEILYKKGYLAPLLRCVGPEQSKYLVKEVHEGICGAHFGARSVVAKLMNLGYFWPSIHRDTVEQLKKCDACQIHSPIPKSPKHDLVPITSAWPFHKWGMDIVGPFPPSKGGVKFLLVAIDYFSKWPEVKPLAKITGKQIIDFVWENIICRYGLPGVIVTDNGKQFAEKPFSLWCKEYRINQIFSSVAYPQSNGQVERTNRSIVEGIKTRLGRYESNWLEELPSVLWAIRTTEKASHRKTPYSLVFGSEAVIPAEIGVVTQRIVNMDPEVNTQETMLNLQLLEEARDQAAIQEAKYKQRMESYYNKKVKNERFKPGDLVLRNNEASKKENQGKLGPKWEGPYTILEAHKGGSYKLGDLEGKRLPRHWNGKTLRKFYV
ncbi:putative nucleotidyltransferase, Ribonuclease H [Helianthus annuus]|nr:putative nucleotidyltransferase, Ribonuclease H [Helianthus annuus]KAJ0505204.1 putative nucleotidyltransferase, Ribonuclease H [Helianthus annuus]KAJ0674887.1 putative nucleotidyltransferase, Ribonuclease H [Helianthus annuus]